MSNVFIPAGIRDKATRDTLIAIVKQLKNGNVTITAVPPNSYDPGAVGDIIYASSDSSIWIFDGDAWTQGPVGPTGPAGADGDDGADGSDAIRYAEITLYTNPTVANAPSSPSATITWSTGAISSITSGWSQTPPTISATSTNSVYSSQLIFIDETAPFTTTTVTGTTPIQSINFTGVVTFNSGDFVMGGSTITTIDGDNITTGTITTDKLNIDETLTLSGPESGFIAGRTNTSDFGTDGFYIGRTTTNGTTADGFQLSHTSVIGANHPILTQNTVTGVVHDDFTGLQIYEPVFYRRNPELSGIGALLDVQNETVRLAANESHTITVYGGGGGGASGTSSGGTTGNTGGTGGTTTITMTTVPSGYNGTTSFTGTGAAGGTGRPGGGNNSAGSAGLPGASTEFGAGGTGGAFNVGTGNATRTDGSPGTAPDTGHYGAGGGGGGGGHHLPRNAGGPGGNGGGAATGTEYTIDLTGLGAATLTATTIGAGGTGGAAIPGNDDSGGGGAGGAGLHGVAYLEGVLGGYIAHSLGSILDRLDVLES